jgi:hypothetical protein
MRTAFGASHQICLSPGSMVEETAVIDVTSRSPLRGQLVPFFFAYPGLTSWAIICRPYGGASALAIYVFGEHFFGVDGYEDSLAAGQDFAVFVEDFGGVYVGAALYFDFAAFYTEGFVQGDWF